MYFKYIFLKSKPIFQSFYINVLSCKLNMIKDNNYCHFYLKLLEFLAFLLEFAWILFAWIEIGYFKKLSVLD